MTRHFHFGDWDFDPDADVLCHGEYCETLEPRIACLLTYFLEHPNEVLSHDQLIDTVWDGRIVSDEAVRRGVSCLRHAMADKGGDKFIRTVHKKGYVANFPTPLTGQFDTVADEAARQLESLPVVAQNTARSPTLLPQIAILLMLLALAVTGLLAGSGQLSTTEVIGPTTDRSIAVLPFRLMDDSTVDQSFADGLTIELTDLLAQNQALQVASRTSAFQYKRQRLDIREIAGSLGVRYIVEGSVRRSRGRVRISAKLIDADTGFQLWAKTYDSNMEDLFELQQDIGHKIARRLEVVMVRAENVTPDANQDR